MGLKSQCGSFHKHVNVWWEHIAKGLGWQVQDPKVLGLILTIDYV